MSNCFLLGLELSNFRGIGNKPQRIAPFSDINFFIGPNNAGKSTLLIFISKYLNASNERTRWVRKFEALDRNAVRGLAEVKWSVAVRKESSRITAFEDQKSDKILNRIIDAIESDGLIWLSPSADGNRLSFHEQQRKAAESAVSDLEWSRVWVNLTKQSHGGLIQHWIPETLKLLEDSFVPAYPAVSFVPAIREIGPSGESFDKFDGSGLIDRLAELQNPSYDRRFERDKFDKINSFLRSATETEDAQIEIPFDRRHVLVHMDGRILPLESLGTGVHEVVMLAAFCTLVENQIVCIEEPEIHLHPLLQRRLMQYLKRNTSNQYFIATHSASLIDSIPASIFGVTKDESADTQIGLLSYATERYQLCRSLGYRASDLMQANSIIWVEGPSDRVYLNAWISSIAPELIEGNDYSIMFYGGRLLSHLTADDPEVDEFISLRRLNRNIFIVIDSDKKSSRDRINKTKLRVSSEFGDDACWITAGREIENYVSPDLMSAALKSLYPDFNKLENADRYASRLAYYQNGGSSPASKVDKMAISRKIVSMPIDMSVLDLKARINKLVKFIREANH